MTRFTQIGVVLTEDYSPLVAMIDAMAEKDKTSRSAVVRDKLSEIFNFTPEGTVHKYDSRSLRGSRS